MKKIFYVLITLLILPVWGITVILPLPVHAQLMDPKNAEAVAHGKKIYAKHCASCHGIKLQGQPNWQTQRPDGTLPAPPHDETGHTWHHPDLMLFQVTKRGGQAFAPPTFKSTMPAFEKILTDDDIWAVLSFIKSKWPQRIQDRHNRMNDHMRRNK